MNKAVDHIVTEVEAFSFELMDLQGSIGLSQHELDFISGGQAVVNSL